MPNILTWISTNSASFTTAANYSPNTAPQSGDTIVFNSLGTAPCTNNISSSLTGLTIYWDKGAPPVGSVVGGVQNPLNIIGGTLYAGRDPSGGQSPGNFLYIRTVGTNSFTATILSSARQGGVTGLPSVMLEGPLMTVNATGGTCGIAIIDGTTASGILNVVVGNETPTVTIGTGATISTVTASGGTITSLSNNTISNMVLENNSTMTVIGAGAMTTVNVGSQAKIKHWGAGNVTTLTLSGTFDRVGDSRSITISSLILLSGASFSADNGVANSITRSSVTLSNCSIQNITVALPIGEKL